MPVLAMETARLADTVLFPSWGTLLVTMIFFNGLSMELNCRLALYLAFFHDGDGAYHRKPQIFRHVFGGFY
jgi:hypothetical protein